MVQKATLVSRLVAAVGDDPIVVSLDVHKKTYSVALFSKDDGLVESYSCPSGETALAHQLTELGINIEQEGYCALVRRRKPIAESRGKIKQKIKGFLLASGINEPHSIQKWSLAASADLTALDVPPQHHMALASMVRSGSQGTLQSTFCEAWDWTESHCRCRPQARNQALAFGGGSTALVNGGCCERGLVEIIDSKKGQHPHQPEHTENGTW